MKRNLLVIILLILSCGGYLIYQNREPGVADILETLKDKKYIKYPKDYDNLIKKLDKKVNELRNEIQILAYKNKILSEKVLKEKDVNLTCEEGEIVFDSKYGFKACIPNYWAQINEYTNLPIKINSESTVIGYLKMDRFELGTAPVGSKEANIMIDGENLNQFPEKGILYGIDKNGYSEINNGGLSRIRYYLFGTKVVAFYYGANDGGIKRFFETITSKY